MIQDHLLDEQCECGDFRADHADDSKGICRFGPDWRNELGIGPRSRLSHLEQFYIAGHAFLGFTPIVAMHYAQLAERQERAKRRRRLLDLLGITAFWLMALTSTFAVGGAVGRGVVDTFHLAWPWSFAVGCAIGAIIGFIFAEIITRRALHR